MKHKVENYIASGLIFSAILAAIYGAVTFANHLGATQASFAEACAFAFGYAVFESIVSLGVPKEPPK